MQEVILDGGELQKLLNDKPRFDELARRLYNELDENQDGNLTSDELLPAIQTLGLEYGLPPRSVIGKTPAFQDMMKEIFAHLDTDKNGVLCLEEYEVLLRDMLGRLRDGMKIHPIVVRVLEKDVEESKGKRVEIKEKKVAEVK